MSHSDGNLGNYFYFINYDQSIPLLNISARKPNVLNYIVR